MTRRAPSLHGVSEAELVTRALRGHTPAFDELVRRHEQRAVSIAYRLVGNVHDALEVCQEAFVRAHRHLPTLEQPDRFAAWLLRIVTNLALNHRRTRRPRTSVENGVLDESVPAPPSRAGRPGADLAAEELAARIHTGLTRLTDPQRAALVLFSIEHLPQKQVAEILGCSVEGVKWHVFQARKKMKAHLADYL